MTPPLGMLRSRRLILSYAGGAAACLGQTSGRSSGTNAPVGSVAVATPMQRPSRPRPATSAEK